MLPFATLLAAIALGTLFFSAWWSKHYTKVSITLAIVVIRYINGPNFMVKAIADHRKVHTPTFLGYIMLFTLPYMLPILVVVC